MFSGKLDVLKLEGIVNLQIFWVVRLNDCLTLRFDFEVNNTVTVRFRLFSFMFQSIKNYVSNSHSKSRRRLKKLMS